MSEGLSKRDVSDEVVVTRVKECVATERQATAALISWLAEFDLRRLYLGQGFSSLFQYCTQCLHLSERASYSRIEEARLVRRFTVISEFIADSRVSLTAVAMLARHLTEANHRVLLEGAVHKTVREVEVVVARLAPKPDAPALVRRVVAAQQQPFAERPAPSPLTPLTSLTSRHEPEQAAGPGPPRPPVAQAIKPLAPERFRVQFTISGEARERLTVAQDLLRHSVPSGDIAEIFDRALIALIADLEKKKLALVARPRGSRPRRREAGANSRVIPAAVRREVWRRDKGRCAFVGADGRCRERGGLELHHVKPFAAGGTATVGNIQLRCRAHNAHEADVYFAARAQQQRAP